MRSSIENNEMVIEELEVSLARNKLNIVGKTAKMIFLT